MGCYIITGASSGIGLATAKKLLEKGEVCILTSRNEDKLNEIYSSYENAKIFAWDIGDIEKSDEYVKTVVSKYGKIRGFTHCAGFDKMSTLNMINFSDLHSLYNIHVFAPMKIVGQISKRGNFDEGASIVLISSLAAHEGSACKSMYASCKGALEGFLKSAASELSARGVRINVIVPGLVETEMSKKNLQMMGQSQMEKLQSEYPLGIGQPEDAANAICFLLSQDARWITGTKLILDGGHMSRKI